MPRLIVAAIASGVGKTTVTAGIIAALRQRGLAVQPFKCGPDYLDPTYHARAAGRPCRNLDAWMLEGAQLVQGFHRATADADVAVIEGVMGVLDGAAWESDQASTAHIARLLGAPVVLVLDISGAARSAAIAVAGCQRLDPGLSLAGVILNHAGSSGHAAGCARAIESLTGIRTLGWLPRDRKLQIPERHLGLIPSAETGEAQALIDALGQLVAEHFAVDALLEAARGAATLQTPSVTGPNDTPASGEAPILAVARDDAFCFYYPENLELLADEGVRLEFFSPLRGELPNPEAAGIYFGGGYPELHAQALSDNEMLWNVVRTLHARNAPIYAECGGFMVLTEGLTDVSGRFWPMAGLLPGRTGMSGKLAALGYRRAEALQPNLLAAAGGVLRAHEFHYSHWTCNSAASNENAAWRIRGMRSDAPPAPAGFVRGNLLASYLHLHFAQDRCIAPRFAAKLRAQLSLLGRGS